MPTTRALLPQARTAFAFADPGPLVDEDLELVAPSARWVDAVLAAHHHPLTLAESPSLARTTRRQIARWLRDHPQGRCVPEPGAAPVYSYAFWMVRRGAFALQIVGNVGLRVGPARELEMVLGHLGYNVYPAARGHHFAERACRLLFPLARRHGLRPIWITCNPENRASRRTCERLGGVWVDTVPVPRDHPLYTRGEREKCRYRVDL